MSPIELLQSFVRSYGYLAVLALVALESAGLPLPAETALVAAAAYAGQGALDIRAVIAVAAIGAITGDACGYWIGRRFGFPLLLRVSPRLGVDEAHLKVAQYLFLRHGGKIVFFGRFFGLLRMLSALLAGANRLPWRRFLLFNALGGIIWAIAFGGGGYALGFAFERYARPVAFGASGLAALAAIAAVRYAARHIEALREAAEAALPGPLAGPKF